MTDLLDDFTEGELDEDSTPSYGETLPARAHCVTPQCINALPLKGAPGFAPGRKYCDEHKPRSHKPKMEGPRDAGPPSINVSFGQKKTTKSDKVANEVEEGATELLKMVALLFGMSSDTVCPAALVAATPALAAQLGALSKFHPGLKKIFAGSEDSAELWMWLGLLMASAPVLITVLVHHGLIPESLSERLVGFLSTPEA